VKTPETGKEASVNTTAIAELVSRIHQTNQMEIEIGQLGMRKAGTAELRRYGDLLVRDHRLADRRLLALAKDRKIELQPVVRTADESRVFDELTSADKKTFDGAFLKAMDEGHGKAITMLEEARAGIKDDGLRRLVVRLVPILHQHQDLAGAFRPVHGG
jgi:putative membrane protein